MSYATNRYESALNDYQDMAKKLEHTVYALVEVDKELTDAESRALLGNIIDGKNDAVRKAQLNEFTKELRDRLSAVKADKQVLEIQMDAKRQELNMYHAIISSGRE